MTSIPLVFLLWPHIFRHISRSHFQSLSFFLLDFVLAIHGSSSCLSIGHAEDIIGLNSSIHTTISWDRISKFLCLILWSFNTVEYFHCLFISLIWLCLRESLILIDTKEDTLVSLELLLLNNFICFLSAHTIKFVHCLGRNRLLQVIKKLKITFLYESSYLYTPTI